MDDDYDYDYDYESSLLSHSPTLATTNLVCSSNSRIHIITLLHLYFSVATVILSTLLFNGKENSERHGGHGTSPTGSVAHPGIFFGGVTPGIFFRGGSTNSVEDRGQRERGSALAP
jgi:hypothetical protein